jgi:predicted TIM-barrel fold metal-dependent hydrolase
MTALKTSRIEEAGMKLWTHSGDSHALEPADLWAERMPPALAERMPRTEDIDQRTEVVHVDGRSFERHKPMNPKVDEEYVRTLGRDGTAPGMSARELNRPPGAFDVRIRLGDLDQEGVWGELVYPSIGLWAGLIRDPVLYREGVKVFNDWLKETFLDVTPRAVPAAEISILSVDDAVAETVRAADMGFSAISLPSSLERDRPGWNDDSWEPLWAAAEDAGLVLGVHVGSDAKVPEHPDNRPFKGPGGAVMNYVESSYSGQRMATTMVASGVLDRHPKLRLLVSEGGATWVPFIADRIEEGYRQHGVWVRPKLSRPPHEIVYEQVYASFQHDKSAIAACTAMGYRNVMFGSDYPHLEGTFGHTQKTLHELFDDVDEATTYRITRGAFLDLFPGVGEPPREADDALIDG